MQTNNKIQAFTLSEMVVVMIITSIVIGLAFSVLTLVQKHMNGIQNNFNNHTELSKLEQSFWLDFNRYSNIKYNAIEDVITFKTNIDSITYIFKETYIIKAQDTFKVPLHNKLLFFEGNSTEQGDIDALKLELTKTFQNQVLFVFKQNDATLFMD